MGYKVLLQLYEKEKIVMRSWVMVWYAACRWEPMFFFHPIKGTNNESHNICL